MRWLLLILFCLILAVFGLRWYIQNKALSLSPINFTTLTPPSTPNYCLVKPDAALTKQSMPSKMYHMSSEQLQKKLQQVIAATAHTHLYSKPDDQSIYVTKSRFFGFPDVAYVQVMPANEHQSQLMIYSHAVYGHSDFGVNCKKVKKWLDDLDKAS